MFLSRTLPALIVLGKPTIVIRLMDYVIAFGVFTTKGAVLLDFQISEVLVLEQHAWFIVS